MEDVIAIRPIEPQDNVALAEIIRTALSEFGANKPGTVFFDPTTDALFELFRTAGSYYFVATLNNKLVGGCGIFPTENLPEGTCELVKLYVNQDMRGTGIGKKLMEKSMEWAKANGYTQVYLESMPELSKAVSIYEKQGFIKLSRPLGNSGHDGCDIWMTKTL
ncbi:GNAT family N-acetyltransferase [Aquirufa regiilacus]|uniref:GNAT family N-acetyltransferase n=1 Tax=Aquirufa regiilacus TaxID=3024868 RepID=A0ABU3TT56_9BACT|nr:MULTISPECIES: GNAT family N-acetyltransferase [unclassified Aquirufa]MDT8887745.1 GNAT family N-acetyltransferase [Aquirufa sp. LEPPI-3A]MDU0809044.1 GNAT family N-acetyltransferase [Aquirufa sp. LEOWEIH-7C]